MPFDGNTCSMTSVFAAMTMQQKIDYIATKVVEHGLGEQVLARVEPNTGKITRRCAIGHLMADVYIHANKRKIDNLVTGYAHDHEDYFRSIGVHTAEDFSMIDHIARIHDEAVSDTYEQGLSKEYCVRLFLMNLAHLVKHMGYDNSSIKVYLDGAG